MAAWRQTSHQRLPAQVATIASSMLAPNTTVVTAASTAVSCSMTQPRPGASLSTATQPLTVETPSRHAATYLQDQGRSQSGRSDATSSFNCDMPADALWSLWVVRLLLMSTERCLREAVFTIFSCAYRNPTLPYQAQTPHTPKPSQHTKTNTNSSPRGSHSKREKGHGPSLPACVCLVDRTSPAIHGGC